MLYKAIIIDLKMANKLISIRLPVGPPWPDSVGGSALTKLRKSIEFRRTFQRLPIGEHRHKWNGPPAEFGVSVWFQYGI